MFHKALINSRLIKNENTLLNKLYKKTQVQYDVTIESCTVHKFSEKSIFHPNKQPKFTKTTTK